METFEQWQKVKEIVGLAVERPPAERAAYLDRVCSQDDELRKEVESLLSAYQDSERLSEAPWRAEAPENEAEPQVIGPYRLLRELGVGGMGQVWLAEQSEPVRRQVALKLIKAGMCDASIAQRFRAERQSLAMMDHPAIAKVFDAGTTSVGQPYLVMEYVDGLSITDYCDAKKLGIPERLQLLIRVCEGVQHAHQKAIIHRDLKPSNILVVEVDGKPAPRIIDFGLAKAIAPLVPGDTLFTQMGVFLGTPGYMSPEQADPEVHHIDTRTDVYSLGAILYELLTGFLPFEAAAQWEKQRLEDVVRQLREEDPPRPSAKITMNRSTSTSKAEVRGTKPKQLAALLRGDLDWITLKGIEKDREKRYPTPSALAVDIENYLSGRPVIARPASLGYRSWKYVRRHAAAVGMASAAIVLLAAFAIMQSMELRRITRDRDRADRITEFMTNMFKVSDPSEARGNTVTAREILDKSAKGIDAGLDRDPELKAQMLDVMGTVYEGLGLYSRAETLLKQAVHIRTQILGTEGPSTLNSAQHLAWTLFEEGRYNEAERMSRDLIAVSTQVLGADNRNTLLARSNLAWILDMDARFLEAEGLCREVLQRQQHVLGAEDPDTLESARRLAAILGDQGHFPEAENTFRMVLDTRRRVLGFEHPLTLKASDDLGIILVEESRYGEAEQLLQQTLDASNRLLGPDHPDTLITMGNLATVFENQGFYSKSEKLQRDVLARCRRTLGKDHPLTALALYNIGDVLYYEHRYSEASLALRETVEIQTRVLGAGHRDRLDSVYKLARALSLAQNRDESIAWLQDAIGHGIAATTVIELEQSEDWKFLRRDPQFQELIAQAHRHSEAQEQKH